MRRASVPLTAEWPFVGRDGELLNLRTLLTGRGRGVVLAGPAGVGKTRLALECLQVAERAGMATARVTASRSAQEIPFGALAPLLPADPSDGGAAIDRAQLLRRSAAALVERAEGKPLIVFVDDAHLLDDASATLIHQLAATGAAMILATVRRAEQVPDLVVALWKDGLTERIEVEGLDAEAVEEVLSAVLGGAVDKAAAAHLAIRCQGNALFLRELVLGALADGALQDVGGIWRLVRTLSPSERLTELVEARLAGLLPDERRLLEAVSFGEPLGLAELNALSDPALAESVESKGFIVTRVDSQRLVIHLAHPLYGDVLRARIPALRRRSIARALAEAVEATGARRREDTLRVATWRLEGGGARTEQLVAAAFAARWRYDFPLAESLARAALDLGAGFDAALLAAQLASLQGRGAEADAQLGALAAQASDDSERYSVAVTWFDSQFYAGTIEEDLRMIEGVEATLTNSTWRDEITARRSALLLAIEGPRVSAEVAEPLLHRAEGKALVWACIPASYSLARLGRIDAALEAADRGHATQLTLNTPMDWYPWLHFFYRGEALAHAGRLQEATSLAKACYEAGLSEHSVEAQAHFAFQLAKTVADRGHVDTAVRYGTEAVALYRQLGRPQFVHFNLVYLALALAVGGRGCDADEALQALEALDIPESYFMGVDALQARGWAAVAGGDVPCAVGIFEEAASEGQRVGDLVGAAAALHNLARIGHVDKGVAARLAAVAADIEGELASSRAAHCEALVRRDPEELLRVSSAFEAMGADLLAAEAAADAAVAWRRTSDSRAAAAAEQRAGVLADRCEGANTPALRAIETRARLTPSELSAAQLAAAGRTNKEIAEHLFVSVRTVEGRLQHVYDKLGIAGRSELAAALRNLRSPGAEKG